MCPRVCLTGPYLYMWSVTSYSQLGRELPLPPCKSLRRAALPVLDISPLSDISVANILSHPLGCLFTFLMASSEEQKLLLLTKSDSLMKTYFRLLAVLW